ncbi:alcohol dehydrogenase/S-(hydroxymethyl)glutathione dehydrogenase/alcohol dehydrogenase [Streptomyces umbrinus]|uniref:alcohol dehydrogenase catalytic domain-containing protein n=1 Tax=Streptomyces umbrinus TaxID=67370 RepID=UPI00167E7697|nr:alcohol dehydrogenase catalytic domain-containing protein [Streptomyces umbrinus]MCR3731909.1 alcohol dehydrogenase/S-(hydroxymethyl)glutathione dehydrogenase/alcohol dehydrogenase [Streptomyces umbrinus]GHH66410.1 alcohol dehydrogenase [Streptomyces umbrinus]
MTETRAALFRHIGAPLSVETITLDPPDPTEVQVQVRAVGLCHTELHVQRGERPVGMRPMVLGHEGAGVVEAVGTQVRGINVGDHVAMTWIPACGVCRSCVRGEHQRCAQSARIALGPQLEGGFRRRDKDGLDVGSFCLIGAFAERTVVDQASVVVVEDKSLPFAAIALSACSAPAAVGAVTTAARVQPTESVLVIGTGGTGMNVVQAARNAGATTIIAVDPNQWKLDLAQQLGATAVIPFLPGLDLPTAVLEFTGGLGVDHSFVCADPVAMTGPALRSTTIGGGVVVTGAAPADASAIEIPPADLLGRQKSLMGSVFGSFSQLRGVPRVLGLYRSGQLDLDTLVTKTYSLEDINQGYTDLSEGRILRGILTPSQ